MFTCEPYAPKKTCNVAADRARGVLIGQAAVNTLEKCAQWCNDIQNCRYFLWRPDVSFCLGFSEKCTEVPSTNAINLYDMNTCKHFDASNKLMDDGNF